MPVYRKKGLIEKPWYYVINFSEEGSRKRRQASGFKTKKEALIAMYEAQTIMGVRSDASIQRR